MRNIKTLAILIAAAFGFNLSAIVEPKIYNKVELVENIDKAIMECRNLIIKIDKESPSLWQPKLGILAFAKKKELAAINKYLSFNKYLDYINDMKLKNARLGLLTEVARKANYLADFSKLTA